MATKKVRAVVDVRVQGVATWQEAYDSVFALVKGPAIHNHVGEKYHSAYLDRVISVERAPDTQAAVAELTVEIERLRAESQGRLEHFQRSEESRGAHFMRAERLRAFVQKIIDLDVPEGDEAAVLNALKWAAPLALREPRRQVKSPT